MTKTKARITILKSEAGYWFAHLVRLDSLDRIHSECDFAWNKEIVTTRRVIVSRIAMLEMFGIEIAPMDWCYKEK
jgi:hypothetical protein